MQRKNEVKTRRALWIEHIVWHAAAGAVLAVMILVLLLAVQWLDQVAPQPGLEPAPVSPSQVASPAPQPIDAATQVAGGRRPSG